MFFINQMIDYDSANHSSFFLSFVFFTQEFPSSIKTTHKNLQYFLLLGSLSQNKAKQNALEVEFLQMQK